MLHIIFWKAFRGPFKWQNEWFIWESGYPLESRAKGNRFRVLQLEQKPGGEGVEMVAVLPMILNWKRKLVWNCGKWRDYALPASFSGSLSTVGDEEKTLVCEAEAHWVCVELQVNEAIAITRRSAWIKRSAAAARNVSLSDRLLRAIISNA